MRRVVLLALLSASFALPAQSPKLLSYAIVDTGISTFYSARATITAPQPGEPFYGQDAQFSRQPASYRKNADGTVSDLVTGLMWESDMGEKMTLAEAEQKARASRLGGFDDWRVPSVKELYSLINYSGIVKGAQAVQPFIDTRYFKQPLGDASRGEREIDAQTWSATVYRGKTMRGDESIFGVNFVDGRIKAYPKFNARTRSANKMYFRLVRGNRAYGQNQFVDNKDGTVSDLASGLMWQKSDSQQGMDWAAALHYAANLKLAGHADWRLPSAKELQSIVDYSRSPQATQTAAIDPVFDVSRIQDASGRADAPFFWTATTLLDGPAPGDQAVYVCFGEALAKMNGNFIDAHGAGAVRSDPKSGQASEFPSYFGPQGDVRYVFNYVRAVRAIK